MASTTVSGYIKSADTSVPSKIFVRFVLKGTTGGLCRVNGATLVAPYVKDVTPDTSGFFSTTVYSNSEITCGSATGQTFYGVTVFNNNHAGPESDFQFTVPVFDYTTYSPGAPPLPQPPNPPPPAPPAPGVPPPSPTTTLSAETANNTSACPASGSVLAGCSGNFSGLIDHCGQSDTSGGTYNGSCTVPGGHAYVGAPGPPTTPKATNYQGSYSVPPAGNTSQTSFKTLLYPGFTGTIITKIVCHAQLWFGDSSHIASTKQTSSNSSLADRQIQNMIDRGCDVVTVDWYGQGALQDQVMQVWLTKLDSKCSNGTCPLYFAFMEDHGTHTGSPTCSQDSSVCVARFETDLLYAWSHYMNHQSYWKVDDHASPACHSRPVFLDFGWTGTFSNSDWGTIKSWIHSAGGLNSTCDGEPVIASEGENGLSNSNEDGAYAWIGVNGYDNAAPGTATVQGESGTGQFNVHLAGGSFGMDSWYSVAKNHPLQPVVIGVAYAGFNDSSADWGFASSPSIGQARKVARQCGQVWLATWARLSRYYSSANQIPAMGIAVWDDYEEGPAIEPGIDNCYDPPTLSIVGNNLAIALNKNDATFGSPATIQSLTLYASTNASDLIYLASLPVLNQTISMAQYVPPLLHATTYSLYVKQNGKPGIQNQMSAPVSYLTP